MIASPSTLTERLCTAHRQIQVIDLKVGFVDQPLEIQNLKRLAVEMTYAGAFDLPSQ